MSRRRVLALALGGALAAGCVQREGSPETAYRAFVRAAADRDAERVWASLSTDTRAWLDERARVAAARAPGILPAGGKQLVLGDAALTARPLAAVVLRRESRDRAVLEVAEEGGAPREVELVREQGWRVRLPAPP
ncbi:MAG TPA: hypothetical protein VEM76_02425 [Anaeromyxobacteraceae bacterium]|nr:hypothetical protein [Anaeromyxobacteraceae bacterium]